MATWTISIDGATAVSPESLEVTFAGITERTQSASTATLIRNVDFDEAGDPFEYGTPITILRDGTVKFRGKVRSNPRSASSSTESQNIEIIDVWDELERTTYQEDWLTEDTDTPVPFARAVLGINDAGAQITTANQIENAVAYASSVGIDVQAGTFPTGFILWPSEIKNVSVADIIKTSMRFHPNWVVSMDYSTDPTTLSVIDQASASTLSYALDGSDGITDFSIRPVSERVPNSVRIVYETLSSIDDVVYRSVSVDKFPLAGPNNGVNVLNATIQLSGIQATTQSQPIEVKDMPTSQAEAKTWLKEKFPSLADIADTSYNVTFYERRLIPEGTQPDPVNPNAPRLEVLDFDELPRELISGTISDWMRVKVGKVEVTIQLAATSTASEPERRSLPFGPQKIIVTNTNAITKVYRGLATWAAGEDAPAGIAEDVYTALENTQYEGYIRLALDEIPSGAIIGKKLNLTAGRSEWTTMGALISEVTYDIQARTVEISFGPPKYLNPADWIELQRAFRLREPKWTSNRDSADPEETGKETVGGYDIPQTTILGGTDDAYCPFKLSATTTGGSSTWIVSDANGTSITDGVNGAAIDLSSAGFNSATSISTTSFIVLEASVDSSLVITGWDLIAVATEADTEMIGITSGEQDKIRLLIGKVTITGGIASSTQFCRSAQIITHFFSNGIVVKGFLPFTSHPSAA